MPGVTRQSHALTVAYAFVPNKAALLHTHGSYLAGYDNDNFFNPYKWVSRFYNIPMYVATPIENLRRYDPKTQEDVCIFTNCPYDSNHPLR